MPSMLLCVQSSNMCCNSMVTRTPEDVPWTQLDFARVGPGFATLNGILAAINSAAQIFQKGVLESRMSDNKLQVKEW